MSMSKMLASLSLGIGIFAIATATFAGPNGPTATNSDITNRATATSISVESVQGSSGGGRGGFSIGGLRLSGGGSKSRSEMSAEFNNGVVGIHGNADVYGTRIVNDATAANISLKGATYTNGVVSIGN